MSLAIDDITGFVEDAAETQDALANGETQRFADGLWTSDWIIDDPPVLLSGGLHAAELWRATGSRDAALFDRAAESFDGFISEYQNANGWFCATDWPATQFTLQCLGPMYSILAPYATIAQRAAWQESLRDACYWLRSSGNTTWYANGNIVLGTAFGLWYSATATGDVSIMDDYEKVLRFATDPTLPTWEDHGLRFSTTPVRADFADAKGYLTENEGLDWGYSQYSASLAARLWLENHDERILALANLFLNQVWERTDTDEWTVDGSGGSRTTNTVPFFSCALAILAWYGARTSHAEFVAAQLDAASAQLHGNAVQEWGNPAIWRFTGLDGGGILAAASAGDG